MINFDDATKENMKEHNPNWSQIPDHSQRILTVGGSRSENTNSVFNLLSQQEDIGQICLYAKSPYEAKLTKEFLFNKRQSISFKHLNDCKDFIEYLNDMDDIYKNIEEYNRYKKRKILIVFDDMIADMLYN